MIYVYDELQIKTRRNSDSEKVFHYHALYIQVRFHCSCRYMHVPNNTVISKDRPDVLLLGTI